MAAKNQTSVKEFIMDGWVNILTSIGIKGKDKLTYGYSEWTRMLEVDAEHTYAGDDVSRNIVDVVPEDSMSKGYKITGLEKDQTNKLVDRLKQLKLDARIVEAGVESRMHGGAGIFMVSTQALKQDQPIGEGPIKGLIVLNRWNLRKPSEGIVSEIINPRYEQADYYEFTNNRSSAAKINEKIHHSRIVEFDGMYLPRRLKQQNENWGDSILNVCKNAIRNYNLSHESAAYVLQDFSVPVMKMKDLSELMNSDCDDKIVKRLQMINMSKSIAKMIVMDADKEDFDHKTRNVTGFKEILEKVEGRLVTASKMPHTKLFGNSPAGLGGSGRHEETNWYDHVSGYQNNTLKEKMLQIIRHVAATEFGIKDTSIIDIEFEPLWALDEKEEAVMRKTVAETDQIYITNQVVTPDEVAKSRFAGEKFNMNTEVDMALREKPDFNKPDDYAQNPGKETKADPNPPVQGE